MQLQASMLEMVFSMSWRSLHSQRWNHTQRPSSAAAGDGPRIRGIKLSSIMQSMTAPVHCPGRVLAIRRTPSLCFISGSFSFPYPSPPESSFRMRRPAPLGGERRVKKRPPRLCRAVLSLPAAALCIYRLNSYRLRSVFFVSSPRRPLLVPLIRVRSNSPVRLEASDLAWVSSTALMT